MGAESVSLVPRSMRYAEDFYMVLRCPVIDDIAAGGDTPDSGAELRPCNSRARITSQKRESLSDFVEEAVGGLYAGPLSPVIEYLFQITRGVF